MNLDSQEVKSVRQPAFKSNETHEDQYQELECVHYQDIKVIDKTQ